MPKTKTQEVSLTKKAAIKLFKLAQEANKEGAGLKLFVYPGGCSGFQYGMDFASKPEKTEKVIEQQGIKIFVDKKSIDFLKGVKIGYVESLQGSGFKIDNPNVTKTCSCGNSVC
jgi:iron-sulfur cluster assembly protein